MILTLTMNPAVDLALRIERLEPRVKLRAGAPRFFAGGGGINCAQAITRLGGTAHAIYAAGGPEGARLEALLEESEVDAVRVPIRGETRQSVTLEVTDQEESFHVIPPGPALDASEWKACLHEVSNKLVGGAFLIASGSLPEGVPDDFYARIVALARERGARSALDTSGNPLRIALDEGADIVKPNRRELRDLGCDPDDPEDCARRLTVQEAARVVVITLGGEGVLLGTAEGETRVPAPRIDPASLLGAGDSFLGAFVLALEQNQDLIQACRWGAAAAAATGLTPGTRLLDRKDFHRLLDRLGNGEGQVRRHSMSGADHNPGGGS
jgi:6-phosphofructokinase 2